MLPWLLVLMSIGPLARPAAALNGSQLLRVEVVSDQQREMLRKMQEKNIIDIWSISADSKAHADVMVPADVLDEVKGQFLKLKTRFRVTIKNVEGAINDQHPLPAKEALSKKLAAKKGHRMDWKTYHGLGDIHGYMDYLAQAFPDVCSVATIGNSVEGRPIKVINIFSSKKTSVNASKPVFYIDGGIHAREWISPASVSFIIKELVEKRAKYPFADKVDFYIVPVINPDGFEYSQSKTRNLRLWRKNRNNAQLGDCAGTDLNRNFGFEWGGEGSSTDPCQEIYAGPSPFSEPESKAIRDFVTGIGSRTKAFVTFHSYGQSILYPWGYAQKLTPDSADLDRVGKNVAKKMKTAGGATYTVGSTAMDLYAAAGVSLDWAKAVPQIKYTYTIELRDTGTYGFLLPAKFILRTSKEAFAAVQAISEELI